jgi:membrane-associated phospholipid phosphatase
VNIPVVILLITGVRSGRYSDASVSIKEQRYGIYLIGGLCLVALLLILIIGKAPRVLTACLVSAIAATIIGYLINLYTTISLHSVAVAGCTMVFLLTMPWIGYLLAIFTPLVGWARIRLKHHTPVQILIGWMVSMVCVFVAFRLIL